jgi:hypothetical protein
MSYLEKFYGFVELDANSVKADDSGQVTPAEIEVLRTGEWPDSPKVQGLVITADDLREYKENFDAGVRAGVPIDLEHKTDGGAVGWFKELRVQGNSLMATVDWTKAGASLIADRAYRFFSPEFAPRGYKDPEGKIATSKNVLIGGALTNRPLFKNLKAIAANDGGISGLTGDKQPYIIYAEERENILQLDTVRKVDPAKLTDEQKSFLDTHKAELSIAEQAAFGFASVEAKTEKVTPAPVVAAPVAVAASEGATTGKEGELVSMTASEVAELKAAAAMGKTAFKELESVKANDKVTGWITANDGAKFKPGAAPKLAAFYQGLTDEQKTAFETDVVGNIPAAAAVVSANEIGATDTGVLGNAGEMLDKRADEIVKASEGKTSYADALKTARVENPQMAKAYEAQSKANGGAE